MGGGSKNRRGMRGLSSHVTQARSAAMNNPAAAIHTPWRIRQALQKTAMRIAPRTAATIQSWRETATIRFAPGPAVIPQMRMNVRL